MLAVGRRVARDQPIVPLLFLLLALMLLLHIVRPGILNPLLFASTLKFAIPLAILAACQTLTMLTGGIDLSVGRGRDHDRVRAGDAGADPGRPRRRPDRAWSRRRWSASSAASAWACCASTR